MTDASPRKKPTQRRSRATVAAIVEATTQLLVSEGYHHLSTNKIAEKAGVSIGSLYQYFPNKEAVVAAVVQEFADSQFQMLAEGIAQMNAEDVDMEQSVRELIAVLFEAKRAEPELAKVVFEELPPVGQVDVLKDWTRQATELVTLALQARADEVRPTDLEVAAFLLVTACHGIVHTTVVSRPELLGDGRLADETAEMVLRYLQPDE